MVLMFSSILTGMDLVNKEEIDYTGINNIVIQNSITEKRKMMKKKLRHDEAAEYRIADNTITNRKDNQNIRHRIKKLPLRFLYFQ